MAVFKAFKPEAMNKIAKAMGYSGDMGQFQSFIEQDPMRQQQMQRYTNAAMQMAKGGVVKMQTGGLMGPAQNAAGGYNPQTGQFTPLNQLPQGPAGQFAPGMPNVTSGRYIDPRGLPDAMRIQDIQPRTKPAGNTGSVAPVQGLTPAVNVGGLEAAPGSVGQNTIMPRGGAPSMSSMSPQQIQEARDFVAAGGVPKAAPDYGQMLGLMSADGTLGTMNTQQPDYSGMTYEQAVGRQSQRDVKSPAEAAAIQAALARGPSMQVQQQIYPQAAVPQQQFQNIDKPVLDDDGNPTGETESVAPNIKDISAQMLQQPGLPTGATTMAAQIQETQGQLVQPGVGTVFGQVAAPTMMAPVQKATPAPETQANLVQATQAAPAVQTALQATQAAQGTLDPRAEVVAAQQTATSVGNVNAAQGQAVLLDNPVQREIQQGELITGVADAQKAAQFTEQIQAAEATPSQQATVQGQLAQLTANFDSANPPAWAAGALRNATAVMAQRGLGASSIAGQAIVQATIEAALPIAQADAATLASFEQMNLSNRQQRSMLAAEQRAKFLGLEFDQGFQARVQNASRIADVANQNFTAEQQVALENSRAANTVNLNNLSNRQALVLAEASALANMDAANLNNRQQAAVQNAQNFLQVDMTNLSNRQQVELFRGQQRIQSLFTDQAAENAARQFNASSQNQVDQFFANLNTQTSQFNASQTNAQAQFNAGQVNAQERFNAEVNNQRDQFNAQNQLVIAQNNAQWRRQIATANTAAVNRANEINASAVLEMSRDGYDNLWNYYADTMEWAWTSAEAQLDRYQEMAIEQLKQDKAIEASNIAASTSSGNAIGNMIATLGSAAITGGLFG